MRRREFITLIGGAAAWPLTGRAQQASTRVRQIAVLLRVAKDDPDAQRDLQAFREGLEALGWLPGKTILIQYRYASADPAQMDAYAAELVGLPADALLERTSSKWTYRPAALRRYPSSLGRPRREAASLQSGCGFLDQTLQREAHRVIKIGGGEVGAAELQLGDKASEEYAALLYR